jgi:putative endonuclease
VSDPRHRLGIDAECLAANHLRTQGWQVLAQRFRVSEGELDLVCLDPGGTLVGVEVRARRSPRAGRALESVDGRRVRRLRSALLRFARAHNAGWREVRLDLVTLDRRDGDWMLSRLEGLDGW